LPDSLQFTSIERLRRTERTIVPFFAAWGYEPGSVLSMDTLYATAYTYYDDATAVPVHTRMVFLRSVFEAVHRESGAREAALLGEGSSGPGTGAGAGSGGEAAAAAAAGEAFTEDFGTVRARRVSEVELGLAPWERLMTWALR